MTDGPADERCETCHRLDPINCPCTPEENPMDYEVVTEDITVDLCTPETRDVLVNVADERVRQVAKWGVQTRPDGTDRNGDGVDAAMASIFKGITDRAAIEGTLTWRDILNEEVAEAYAETDPVKLREELVQVAAVALAWVEDIDRKAAARETIRARLEAIATEQAIADGRLPLRQPGASS